MRPSMLLKRKEKRVLRFYKSIFGKVILLLVGLAISALVFLSLSRSVVAVNSAVFGQPVQVTPDPGKGYEPAVVVDPYGNIFATAHKENWQLVLGPDPNSPTFTRSMSWAWYSDDGGRTFNDLPGLTALSLEQHEFGDEGDMAVDDADHLYFVDTNVVDDTITRWNVTDHGRQFMTLDYTRPLIPTMQAVDDRPWVTAHGDGHVFYFGNEGDKVTYPLGQGQGSGFGPGRYTVYSSYDGGRNFNPFGYTLRDSGWCRPAADHRPGSPYVIAVCGNDGGSNDVFTANNPKGSLYAYVSADDGQTFERFKVGNYQSFDSTFSWPTVSFAPDGSIWALYVDAGNLDPTTCSTDPFGVTSCNPTSNRIMLYHSTDHGRTWSSQNITPLLGRYRYGWLAVSPDGRRLGLGIYYRPNDTTPWRVYGAIWTPGQKPTLVSLDENNPVASATSEAPGDLMGSYFNPDGTLNVVWTRTDPPVVAVRINRTILFARSVTR
jgi:hypothetical protein